MSKILIDAVYPQEIRVAKISKDNKIVNFDYQSLTKKQLKGNIYLAKVTRVEPSLQAAFVEYSHNKHGFLPFAEIHTDYYQLPAEDRKKLEELDPVEEAKISGRSGRYKKIAKTGNDNYDAEDGEKILQAKKLRLTEQYKIQEVIKKNQLILVQVIKEERGNKKVSLFLVIFP